MNQKMPFYYILPVIIISIAMVAALVSAASWTGPSVEAPGNNAEAPLNVGNNIQSKNGPLILNLGGWDPGLIVAHGNVGIGTLTPNYLFTVGTQNNPFGISDAGDIVVTGGTDSRWALYKNSVSKIGIEPSGDLILIPPGTSGNVGIGTTNPGAKLEIVGQIKIAGGSPGAGKFLMSDASGLASWQTPGSGGTVTSISAGVGLSAAPNPITTSGSVSLNTAAISGCTSAATNKIIWDSTNNRLNCATDQAGAGGLSGSGTANYVSKWTGATSLGNSQIFDNGSDVGIGTASPTRKLHVAGNVRITGLANCNTIDTDASGNLVCGTDSGWPANCTSRTVTAPAGSREATASCAGGETMVSGGCKCEPASTGVNYMTSFGPVGNSWWCQCRSTYTATATARCCW